MKTQEEIDELYHKIWDDFSAKYDDNLHYHSFVEGYTQCQENMTDKKYTEEDMIVFAYTFSNKNVEYIRKHLKDFDINLEEKNKKDNE